MAVFLFFVGLFQMYLPGLVVENEKSGFDEKCGMEFKAASKTGWISWFKLTSFNELSYAYTLMSSHSS